MRIAVNEEHNNVITEARVGFAGPQVILNTMCEANQSVYDTKCPSDFQCASYVHAHGQVGLGN
ncbi:hypothetical protein EON63_02280 [archaeon]|nr:MAG: hypothetical protein EON63_02280 [archaeon]